MKNSILKILTFILIVTPCFGQNLSLDNRRQEIIATIDAELKELNRLNKKTKNKRPNLLLRIADLNLEKARHIKEEENEKFLRIDAAKRQKLDKSRYFRRSRQYYTRSKSIGDYIIKKFPRFDGIGAVYYILAHSAREFQDTKKARLYFQRSLKLLKINDPIRSKASLSLAEIYYNEKNYKGALQLYAPNLKNKQDRWWTRDSFNLAWCYFRLGQRDQAISKMREVHQVSKDRNFIDKSADAERDLTYFYAVSSRIKEAISFFQQNGKNVPNNLLKVSKYLIQQGKYASAEKALIAAGKYQKTDKQDIEILFSLIELYDRFGKETSHLNTTTKIFEYFKLGKLDDSERETLVYHLKKMSALLQKQVVSKRYRKQRQIRSRKAKAAAMYFEMLARVQESEGQRYYFLAGETYFANSQYEKALISYDKSYYWDKGTPAKKLLKLANEGIIASLAKVKDTSKIKKELAVPSYENFLLLNPRSEKSDQVYKRLFREYMKVEDSSKAEEVLNKYKRRYRSDREGQQAMLSQLINFYRDKGNKKAVAGLVEKIDSGVYTVSGNFRAKTNQLLLGLQFADVEKANAKGDKKAALVGYLKIYEDSESGRFAKKNAAYNLATLFYELGDAKEMYRWADKSLKLMSKKDISKFESSFLSIAADLFNQQYLVESGDIYKRSYYLLCEIKSSNKKIFFKNATVIYSALNELNKTEGLIKSARRCKVPSSYYQEARFSYVELLSRKGRFEEAKNEIVAFGKVDPSARPKLIELLGKLTRKTSQINKLILSYYSDARRRKMKIPLESLDVVASIKLPQLRRYAKQLKDIKLSFPENRYNQALKQKFAMLDKVTVEGLNLLKVGSGNGIVESYRILIESYNTLASEVQNFKPPGKSKEYLNSFAKGMENLMRPVSAKASEFRKEAVRQINRNEILAKSTGWFLDSQSLITYDFDTELSLMERGGSR